MPGTLNRTRDLARLATLHHHENGALWFSPSLSITALTNTSLAVAAPAYQAAYERFMCAAAGSFAWWCTNTMKKTRPWSAKAADMFPFWMQDPVSLAELTLGLIAQGGDSKPASAAPMLEFHHEQLNPDLPRGGIRFAVAFDSAQDPEAFLQLVRDALADFPLSYGYGGYSFVWHSSSYKTTEAAETVLVPWLMRYPGLDTGDMGPFLLYSHLGLMNVNWLTLLGTAPVQQLGGIARLDALLPSQAERVGLPSGAQVIRACPEPQVGDVNEGRMLEEYRAVGHALRSLRVPDKVFREMNLTFRMDDNKQMRWLERFF